MDKHENILTRAEEVATAAHEGQVDRAGRGYIAHPRRVAANAEAIAKRKGLQDEAGAAIAAAWMHDVVEDTETSESDLRAEFPTEVVDAVMAVTKRMGKPAEDYFHRVGQWSDRTKKAL